MICPECRGRGFVPVIGFGDDDGAEHEPCPTCESAERERAEARRDERQRSLFEGYPERQVWENMLAGRYYIKGERDSQTTRSVLAAREGNYFGPANVYWASIKDLPAGAYYIDGEPPQ